MTQEFEITELEAQPIVGIRLTTKMDETLSQTMGQLFGEVMGYLGESGQAPAGMPLSIYHSMDETMQGSGEVDVECGMPVASAMEGRGRVAAGELPACTCGYRYPHGSIRRPGGDLDGAERVG